MRPRFDRNNRPAFLTARWLNDLALADAPEVAQFCVFTATMKRILQGMKWLGMFPAFLVVHAMADASAPQLPADMPINEDAGRGGYWIVTLRLESGETVPVMVDTGTSSTFLDISLAPKLGAPLGTTVFQGWGIKYTNNVYAAPKLYLGGVPLMTESRIIADNLHLSDREGHAILGVLGYDCLRHYCIQLDFAAGKLRFLNDQQASTQNWGKAFPIVALNSWDGRPSVAANLFGAQGPHSLIDSGYPSDGWLMPKYFQRWTNNAVAPAKGVARSPEGLFEGEKYALVSLDENNVESDGIGLRFLARHLVTLDFPKQTMYLKRACDLPPDYDNTLLKSVWKTLIAMAKQGQLPGFSKQEHGTMVKYDFDPAAYPYVDYSVTLDTRKMGDSSTIFSYLFSHKSKDGPWKLQKVWRTDQSGHRIEEYNSP
jgi:hypothetical protein